MGRASQKFDRELFTLKLSELSHQMQIKSVTSGRTSGTGGLGGSLLLNIVDGELALLRDEWLTGVDRIAREVWQAQRETITPDFVRDVLVPEAMTLIGNRESTVMSSVALAAQRTHFEDPHPAQHHLAMEIRKLKGVVANRYEIEARELKYQKAPATQGSPQSQRDELGGIRGLIEDATKDTVLWLQADPSAEERAHVLAIQERLAGLARIIERGMERRKETKDEWEYSETVSEVLSRLEKARKLRGNIIVGKGLGRLTGCLPQELPGSKARLITQAPAPPPDWHEELRQARNMEDDFGFLTFGRAWDAVRMLAQANDPIDQEKRIDRLWRMYPEAVEKLGLPKLPASGLSHEEQSARTKQNSQSRHDTPQAPVESQANRWRGFRSEFEQLAREEERIERAAPKDRLLRAYCTYREHPEVWEKGKAEQGCFCLLKAPETGLWTLGDGVSENFLERFRALAARAGVTLDSPEGTDPEDFWLHRLWLDLRENKSEQLFAASKEGGVIRRVCEASATFCSRLERKAVTGADRLRTDEKQVESSRAQNSANSAPNAESKPTTSNKPKSPIGRNIDRLRKECGWSFDDLMGKTGIDKKNTLAHVNEGRNPRPSTMKEYAQAFSKALQRDITVADLEK
jgi:hypothetical protein